MGDNTTATAVMCIMAAFAVFMSGALMYDLGIEHGRIFERTEIMNTEVTVGNPTNPECSVEIKLTALAEMAEMGILAWPDACEEASQ